MCHKCLIAKIRQTAPAWEKVCLLLFFIICLVLAAATCLEQARGTAEAHRLVYGTWWFVLLWAMAAAVALAVLLRRKLYRRMPVFLLHAALLLILLGALLTWLTAESGTLHLRLDETLRRPVPEGTHAGALPFDITLTAFSVEHHPGTSAAADYRAELTIEGDAAEQHVLSMNRIVRTHGTRLLLGRLDADHRGVTLLVNTDPWGIPVSYAGYALLALSFLFVLISRGGVFRRTLRRLSAAVLLLALPVQAAAEVEARLPTLSPEQAEQFGALLIEHEGRIQPVASFARLFTRRLTGKTDWQGYTAVDVLAGFAFFPEAWQHAPLLKAEGGELRRRYALRKHVAFADLFDARGDYIFLPYWDVLNGAARPEGWLSDAARLDSRVREVQGVTEGTALRLFPPEAHGGVAWLAPDAVAADTADAAFFRNNILRYVRLSLHGTGAGVEQAFQKIQAWQRQAGGASLPSDAQLRAEHLLWQTFSTAWAARLCLTVGLILFVLLLYACRTDASSRQAVLVRVAAHPWLPLMAWAYVTYGLALRGVAAGRMPMASGYETMLCLVWCVLAVAAACGLRRVLKGWGSAAALSLPMLCLNLAAFMVAGFGCLSCGFSFMDEAITPLMPVLGSPLLAVHVSLVMLAYAGLAFTFADAVIALCVPRLSEMLADVSRLLLVPSLFFLSLGIFLGAVWAGISWGNYWSWDPKETWALITLLVYALPAHGKMFLPTGKSRSLHLYFLFAFLVLLMTYVGTNTLLPGLHSYA
ncbi:MAG: cytochrome c biogenesis protein CcsA [Bacteroidales bacterium]|nr:cytochrome c biogenesis protein CcsA [Bacteroidales bacterium]